MSVLNHCFNVLLLVFKVMYKNEHFILDIKACLKLVCYMFILKHCLLFNTKYMNENL